jgi:hypothetical protein
MTTIRPPEYFPRLSYMASVQAAERFILADTFQYSRQLFQNRSKLRTPQGWQWISIPLINGQHGASIQQVQIEWREPWARKHWRSFVYNYSTAPYFDYYAHHFEPLFEQRWNNLGELTCASVEVLHRLLNMESNMIRASSLPEAPSSWQEVLAAVGSHEISLPRETTQPDGPPLPGQDVFNYAEPPYRQNFDGFVPGMSAVDLLFNYGPEASLVLRQGIKQAAE